MSSLWSHSNSLRILGVLDLESISSLVFWVLIWKYGGNLISTGSFIDFLRDLSKMLFLEKNERNGAKVLKDWPCALVLLSVLFLWSWFTYFCQCRKSLGSFYVSLCPFWPFGQLIWHTRRNYLGTVWGQITKILLSVLFYDRDLCTFVNVAKV